MNEFDADVDDDSLHAPPTIMDSRVFHHAQSFEPPTFSRCRWNKWNIIVRKLYSRKVFFIMKNFLLKLVLLHTPLLKTMCDIKMKM